MKWVIEIPGPLQGHKCSVRNAFSPEVETFKKLVRWYANLKGCPEVLERRRVYSLHTELFWKGWARIDTVNVHKLIEDGLFVKDRRVLQGRFYANENSGREEAVVTFERLI